MAAVPRHTICNAGPMPRAFPCLAAVLIASLAALQEPAPTPGDVTGLLGQPFAAALARLGPPERGEGTGGCVTWHWRDDAGGALRLAVHEDHVVQVDAHLAKGPRTAKPCPAQGFYPGQPVAELLQRLGNPLRAGSAVAVPPGAPQHGGPGAPVAATHSADLLLVYADARLLASAGRVLGPEPAPAPANGPR